MVKLKKLQIMNPLKSKEFLEMVLIYLEDDHTKKSKSTYDNFEYRTKNQEKREIKEKIHSYGLVIKAKDMKYVFNIIICKIPGIKIFGYEFFSRNIIRVRIDENKTYGTTLDTFVFDTKFDKELSKMIKDCYDKIEETNQKIDLEYQTHIAKDYLEDFSKSVDKSHLRDKKLQNILN